MKLYLSGPMSGYPNHNYERFNYLTELLRTEGHRVENPAEYDGGDTTLPYWYYLWRDCSTIVRQRLTGNLDTIVLHGRWWESRGVRIEIRLGVLLGMRIIPIQALIPTEV